MKATNLTRGTTLVDKGEVANSHVKRAIGLLGRSSLPPGGGLLLQPCQSIHTFFMRFPIDVVFVNGDGRIVHIVENMGPNKVSKINLKARYALEMPAGTVSATSTQIGDKLAVSH